MLKFTLIYEEARSMMGIDRQEYALCNYIATWCANPKSVRSGWCDRTLDQKAQFIGITKRGLIKMQNRLIALGLIEKDSMTSHTRTTIAWFETVQIAKSEAKTGELSSPITKIQGELSSPKAVNLVHPDSELSSPKAVNLVHPHNNSIYRDNNKDYYKDIDSPESVEVLSPIEVVIAFLNERIRPARKFSIKNKSDTKNINARLLDKYTEDDLMLVIEYKYQQWSQDDKMKEYLRPETLFSTKFLGYLRAAEEWNSKGRPSLQNNNTNGANKVNFQVDPRSFEGYGSGQNY